MISIAASSDSSGLSPHRLARSLFFTVGVLLVAVGVVGIFLPLLPSTVFFLMAAPCFSKSSLTAHRWLTTNRFFGKQLANYQNERGATRATKLVTLASLWSGIAIATWMTGINVLMATALCLIAIAVSTHVWRLKTIHS